VELNAISEIKGGKNYKYYNENLLLTFFSLSSETYFKTISANKLSSLLEHHMHES